MSTLTMEASELMTIASYDREAQQHFETANVATPSEDLLKARALMKPDPLLLDVGCGTGRLIPCLKEINIGRYVGIDPSIKMLEIARKEHPEMDFMQMDLYSVPEHFPPKHFDAVLAIITLSYIPRSKMSAALKHLHSVMKEGAIGFFTFMDFDGIVRFADGEIQDDSYSGPVATTVGWPWKRIRPCLEKGGWIPLSVCHYTNVYSVIVKTTH